MGFIPVATLGYRPKTLTRLLAKAPSETGRRPARAQPTGRGRLDVPAIDGFRGLAVLWIVLGHCWNELGGKVPLDDGPLRNIFVSSYMGVDMLFIVSGFVLFLPAVMDGTLGDLGAYARRRAARIVPAFWAAVLVSFVVSMVVDAKRVGPAAWLSHALFLHGEAHHHEQMGWGVNGALWTMSVEVMFYAALPFVASWYKRRPFFGLVLAFAGAELWHLAALKLPLILDAAGMSWASTSDAQLRMALAFPTYLPQFAIGMTAAWVYVRFREHRDALKPHAVLVQIAAFTGAVVVAYMRGWEGANDRSGLLDHWVKTGDRTFFYGMLVLATALAASAAQWPVRNAVSRFLGTVCYGTYLVHLPLIKLLRPALGLDKGTTSNLDLLLLAAVTAPAAVDLGWLSYRFLEEPFRRWARRRRAAEPPRHTPRTRWPETAALASAS